MVVLHVWMYQANIVRHQHYNIRFAKLVRPFISSIHQQRPRDFGVVDIHLTTVGFKISVRCDVHEMGGKDGNQRLTTSELSASTKKKERGQNKNKTHVCVGHSLGLHLLAVPVEGIFGEVWWEFYSLPATTCQTAISV